MNAILKPITAKVAKPPRLTEELATSCTALESLLDTAKLFPSRETQMERALKVVDWEAKHAFVPVSEQVGK